jgi:hypothetical protein
MVETMHDKSEHSVGRGFVTPVLTALVVAVCIICCGLILVVPTRSIEVTTVYKGF